VWGNPVIYFQQGRDITASSGILTGRQDSLWMFAYLRGKIKITPEASPKHSQLGQFGQYSAVAYLYTISKIYCIYSSRQKSKHPETRCYLTFINACAHTPSTRHITEEKFSRLQQSLQSTLYCDLCLPQSTTYRHIQKPAQTIED
jgi:hypothetical protein